MLSKPATREAQDQLNTTDEIKPAKQFTRDQFAWLDQIAADEGLPASAFKVAYVISKHINRTTGEAWPSSATIGSRCAMSKPNVVKMVASLKARGHLDVDPGKAGRGHSNHYRAVMKDPQFRRAFSKPAKPHLREV